jgi:succinyl-diaminopimelate desuccinylase
MGPLDDLQAAVAARAPELRRLCRDLVAAPSISPPGDTTAPATVLHDYLTLRGLDPALVAEDPAKPNVVARIEGRSGGRHLVLNVHLDTMPTGPIEQWSVEPHELTERDGRWYGLGMGNMKGAAAAMAVAFVLLAEHRDQWCGTVTFAAVSDEVVFGDAGAAHLIRTRPDLADPDGLLCGEGPGFMRLGLAEKGLLWCRVVATAEPGHASGARRNATATTRLAEALVRLDAHNDTTVELPAALAGVPDEQTEARRLSLNVGTMVGGTFIGQRATEASAEVDIRIPPGLGLADVQSLLADAVGDLDGVAIETLRGWEANWTGLDDPLVAAVSEAAAVVRGSTPVPSVRLPASDASRWRSRGVGAVCYGPQPTLSSGVDDYAEAQAVHDCAVVYAAAAMQFLAAPSSTSGSRTTVTTVTTDTDLTRSTP